MRWQEWLARLIAVLVVLGVPVGAVAYQRDVVASNAITVQARQWEFVPNRIVVHQGQQVTLRITAEDVSHGFLAPDLDVFVPELYPGHTAVVRFTPNKTGTFKFYCARVCGVGHGSMTGEIVVE